MKNLYLMIKEEKEFRLLWLGYTLTIFGEWFAIIAVNLYVWNSYESMILSSISLAINMIPVVFHYHHRKICYAVCFSCL